MRLSVVDTGRLMISLVRFGRYNRYNTIVAVSYRIGDEAFDEAVSDSGRRAFEETLADGQPVFYLDAADLNVMELPGGRRFEIRWLADAVSGDNYEIVRELKTWAA
jgi:hypothetical protein